MIPQPHFVVGHRNPDTDAIVSAAVHAWDLRRRGDQSAVAVRLGDPNRQTRWLFTKAGVPMPAFRGDCRYRADEIGHTIPMVTRHTPLRDALDTLHREECDFVVVIESDGAPCGIISDRLPRLNYLLQCNVEDFLGTLLRFEDLVRGLPLRPLPGLNPGFYPEIQHLQAVWHAEDREGGWNEQTAVFIGHCPELLPRLRQNPPGALVIVDVAEETAASMARETGCPAWSFAGSLPAMMSRLSGCFRSEAAMFEEVTTVSEEALLADVEQALRVAHGGVVVIGADASVRGAVSPKDLLELSPPRLSLVDHCERAQSIEGLERAEIIEIIDHHRLGDIETIEPLSIDARPIGSTATILFSRIGQESLTQPMATLLLGAIVADTLLLRSPTTTPEDRKAANELANIIAMDLHEFGMEVLRQNDMTREVGAEELVGRDLKFFQFKTTSFLLAQVETVDLAGLQQTLIEALGTALDARVSAGKAKFGILMVTDVLLNCSLLIARAESASWIERVTPSPSARKERQWREQGFVSRKKQLLPYVLARLQDSHV